jgi:tetratricopeptide (TPR) repeat protein
MNELAPQEYLNWFFVLSAGVVLAGFFTSVVGSFLTVSQRKLKIWIILVWKSWSSFDRIVLATITAVISFVLLTGLVFPEDMGRTQTVGMFKLGLCLLVYINVLAVYRLPNIEKIEKPPGLYAEQVLAGLKVPYKAVLGIFCIVILLGVSKYISAHFEAEKGGLFIEEGKYGDAIAVLESALKKRGYHSEELYIALGHAYLGLGQSSDAEKHFTLARRTEIDSPTVEKSIGDVYSRMGIWDMAIAAYKRARSSNPDPTYVLDQLSMAYLKNGERMRVIELIKEYDRVPALQLNSVPDRVEFGISLIYAGHYHAAAQQFEQALKSDANSGIVYYGQGLLENEKGEWEKSSALLEKALALDSTIVRAHYELGVAYQNLSQTERAAAKFSETLHQQPDHLLALGQLASLYEREERAQLAEDMRQKMRIVIPALAWKGASGGTLAWNGSCWYETELIKGTVEIVVHANGTPASDIWPIMEVFLDKKKIGMVSVVQGGVYKFETKVEKSAYHKLVVSFVNDSRSGEVGDRNLFVGSAEMRYLKVG